MKKILMIVCTMALTINMVNASVLLNEHFDRSLGTLSAGTWSSGELPNDGNWHTYSPGSVQFQVVSQQLQYADYCSASSGKAVHYTANHSRDYILFENAYSGSANDKVCMAFLLNAGGLQTTSNAMSGTNANNSILSFAINASNNASGSLNGRVVIQTVDDNTYKLGVSRRGEAPQFASNELKTGTTYLIVAEYEFVAGEKNDLVHLYINPTPASQTVAVTSVNPSTANADADKLVGVSLCSNGNTPTNLLVDEVRVATSWDELWESTTPTPAISTETSIDFGTVTVGEPAEKTIVVKGSNLKGAVSVSSDNAVLVPAVASIAKTDAEAQNGYELTLTLTAAKDGVGSAHLTFSSEGAGNNTVDVTWTAVNPAPPAGTELLQNGSFEENAYNALFGSYSFDGWNLPLGSAAVSTTDKLDGDVAMQVNPTSNAVLDQGVTLTDADYAAGTLFLLTLHYKVLSIPEESALTLDCYWEPAGGGDADAMKLHDADVLQQNIATSVSSDWETLSVTTSKPAGSTYFRVRMKIPKNAKVLLDDFSLVKTENTEPYIHVTPSKLSSIETTIGNAVTFPTLHIEQGNLTGTTVFELSYTDADQFSLSVTSLSADKSECDLVITYNPTSAGTHTAYLNIDNEAHSVLHQSIKLQASCTDPSAQPTLYITPNTLPVFETTAGTSITKTFTVSSENCTDYVYLSVNHIQGAAFTIDASMLSKNISREVEVRFAPNEAGTFKSEVTVSSLNATSVTLVLEGHAESSGADDGWATDFVWDDSTPLTEMNEGFDNVVHNKPLAIDGWQNVAAADARPWWGFDETQTSLFDGDGKYAKATAYQFGQATTGDWEMWLVTPALDYKNATSKVFAFSVMGQYLPEEGIMAALEIYYIDAANPENVFKQDLTGSFSIPSTSDEDSQWITFVLDLAPHAETVADVFHMGFRFVGPNGADGAVTYYIDDVSWGVVSTAVDSLQSETYRRKELRDGQLYIVLPDGTRYNAIGTKIQ